MSNPIVYSPVGSESEEVTEPESEEVNEPEEESEPEAESEPESEYDSEETEPEAESEPESEYDSEETEEQDFEEEEVLNPVMDSTTGLAENDGEKGGEGRFCSSLKEGGENSQPDEWNRGDIDGLFCPICMEAWTTDGDHHVCCLPCGHIFGSSCIQTWLQRRGSNKKCPQCNRKCSLKRVRKLFASRVVAIDGESQKRIQSLQEKCISLQNKTVVLSKKEVEWRKKEAHWKKKEAHWEKIEALLDQGLREEVEQLREIVEKFRLEFGACGETR